MEAETNDASRLGGISWNLAARQTRNSETNTELKNGN